MERTWHQPGTITGTGEAMKAVGQARLELSGVSTPDHLRPPMSPPVAIPRSRALTPRPPTPNTSAPLRITRRSKTPLPKAWTRTRSPVSGVCPSNTILCLRCWARGPLQLRGRVALPVVVK